MKHALKVLPLIAVLLLAVLLSGCAGLGRAAQGVAGLVAPEYKATADNVYNLLLQDQLLATLGLEAVFITKEGRVLRRDDVTPTVLTTQQAYSWDSLPRGFIPLFLGEGTRLPPEQAKQRSALAEALQGIPSTATETHKKKD